MKHRTFFHHYRRAPVAGNVRHRYIRMIFLESVISGLAVYAYWEAYVALACLFCIQLLPKALISGALLLRRRSAPHEMRASHGCLLAICEYVSILVGFGVFLLILHPIIFGIRQDAAWSLPWRLAVSQPSVFLTLHWFLFLGVFVAALPLLRHIQLLGVLCPGVAGLYFIATRVLEGIPHPHFSLFFPGIFVLFGFLLISTALTWFAMYLFVLATLRFRAAEDSDPTTSFTMAAARTVTSTTVGMIPLFIYGQWVGRQLMQQ